MVERRSPKPDVEGSSPSGRDLLENEATMGLQQAKESIITYFKGVKSEWGKITWPAKEQVRNETIAVILIVFAFTIFILLLDMVFKGFFNLIKLG